VLDIDLLSRQLAREKKARKEAEEIAESKSRVLYETNLELVDKEHQARVLLEELKQQEQRLFIRHKILETMMKYPVFKEVAPKILEIMCETMQLAEGGFWKLNEDTNKLHCIYTWSVKDKDIENFAETSKQIVFSIGIGLPGRTWKNKTLTWIQDVVSDPNFPRAEHAKKAGLQSAFALPILFEGEVLGVIEFFNKDIYPITNYVKDMLNDISNQIGIFIEREEAQKKVSTLSRLAGMTEVASNVLHNVGNILNSVSVSSEVIFEKIMHSKMDKLANLQELFKKHENDLSTFLINDPQGQKVPNFLFLLLNEWENEKKVLLNESQMLRRNIEQIKNSIMAQQALGQTFGLASEVNIKTLIEEALTLNKIIYEHAGIEIVREFSSIQKVIIDRARLFHIMVNLIKNSIEALSESEIKQKQIILKLHEKDNTKFVIQVSDNGIGILPENRTKIFSHGFTTKKTGHGFGLHACSLYAKELGGSLIADSKGSECGATFILELPYFLQLTN
jgi:signal transduction histidine kinase